MFIVLKKKKKRLNFDAIEYLIQIYYYFHHLKEKENKYINLLSESIKKQFNTNSVWKTISGGKHEIITK